MAILTHDAIIEKVTSGEIRIDPFDERRVGPASIDFTLGKDFRIFKKLHETVELDSDTYNPDDVSEVLHVDKNIILQSGQTVLGVTVEKLTLPTTICGWIQGRSRFARLGLMVHISSSFIQPGVSNHQVLELFNAGPMSMSIHPGIAICQIVFEEVKGSAAYTGVFQGQTKP